MKLLFVLLSLLLIFSVLVQSETAYFGLKTHGDHNDFIFKLTDSKKIQMARDILSGKESNEVHVMGRIKKRPESYNPKFSFILDPDTITFFAMAIEVCDASTIYVEDHLDEACGAFLPGCFWCPWSSKLTREIKV
ncbi:hypothetical protein DDB_G0269116 [Dictyostelium discoideum AX4]|uniref:Putative calmodulin-binding protein CaM-BP15 n=1 Tax=Dictyostelium discoideum TaxID=44689 RepID=Q9U7C7_DICDI|nr:hypothetical protein DDB_G0269116 [Dictyostelium discoideum AX4]AAD56610.1 putative calmodulin-binding protein CaM-BP15 [Dictyostelium discoideum]EAL71908.1 hypothetical protein DDB_G0269116 [Dictyostelium discoideum AX4]|eukprot:XP_646731.1 hypothetical protein DDB_G0269116 [Dictyostelium discoideum AX4]